MDRAAKLQNTAVNLFLVVMLPVRANWDPNIMKVLVPNGLGRTPSGFTLSSLWCAEEEGALWLDERRGVWSEEIIEYI